MKLLYKPFAIIGGMIAARLSRAVFKSVWSSIDDAPPPLPGTGQGSVAKVVGGQALQGAVTSGVRATVDRLVARAFHHLIGAWPEKPPEPDED